MQTSRPAEEPRRGPELVLAGIPIGVGSVLQLIIGRIFLAHRNYLLSVDQSSTRCATNENPTNNCTYMQIDICDNKEIAKCYEDCRHAGGSQIMLAERCQTNADLPPRVLLRNSGGPSGWSRQGMAVPWSRKLFERHIPTLASYVTGKAHPSRTRSHRFRAVEAFDGSMGSIDADASLLFRCISF